VRITEVRDIVVPLEGGIANAVVDFSEHTVSVVALVSDVVRNGRPVTGLAFNSIGRFAQSGLLRERFVPRLLAAPPDSLSGADGLVDPAAVARTVLRNEKPGGHGDRAAAVAALELAAWDLLAKLRDEPAWAAVARHTQTAPAGSADVYAAGWYYRADDTPQTLPDEIRGYLDAGYGAVKIKIGGLPLEDDVARIERALAVLDSPSRLAVDANGRFDRNEALRYAEALEGLGLRWYEEPGDPLDYRQNSEIIATYDGAVATGENLFSAADVVNLCEYGGMRPGRDVFQMDAGLSYGLTEYLRMIDVLEARGHNRRQCYPHGGHLINLHIVVGAGLGGCEAYPDVFRPVGGYSPDCAVIDGRIHPGDAPGFGLERKSELMAAAQDLLL